VGARVAGNVRWATTRIALREHLGMKATLDNHTIAESDDVIACGGAR
jgi:hypothetical protein